MENYNINVKAEYDVPKMDKTNALLKELAIAKEITDETKEHFEPLILAEGKAKFDAIIEQLQPILDGAKELSRLKHDVVDVCVRIPRDFGSWDFIVRNANSWDKGDILWRGYPFKYSKYECDPDGILTRWNEYNIIERLTEDLNRQIRNAISDNQKKTETIKKNHSDMCS